MLSNRDNYLSAFSSMASLKRTSRALANLVSSLDTAIAAAQPSLAKAAYHHGIHALPDELLVQILLHRLDGAKEDARHERTSESMTITLPKRIVEAMVDIALVNKKFRDLIYGVKECWSVITLSPSLNPIFVDRSDGALLEVYRPYGPDQVNGEALEVISECCRSLIIDNLVGADEQTYESMTFTHLESLVFEDVDREEIPDHVKTALQHWILPKLQSISIPFCCLLPQERLAQLTTLKLDRIHVYSDGDVQMVLADLRLATSLRDLELSLDLDERNLTDDFEEHTIIELPHLISYTLRVSFRHPLATVDRLCPRETLKEAVIAIPRTLRTPSLKFVKIELSHFTFTSTSRFRLKRDDTTTTIPMLPFLSINDLLHVDDIRTPLLEHLTLAFKCHNIGPVKKDAARFVSDALRRLSSLRSLSLQPGLDIVSEICVKELAKLRHVRLHGCSPTNCLDRVLGALAMAPVVNLETVSVNFRDDVGCELTPTSWTPEFAFIKGAKRITFI